MLTQKQKDFYTYADYLAWDENERIEIIDGEAVMHATPTRIHQGISGELFRQLANYLEEKPCKVYAAPFTVRLNAKDDDSDTTVLEPDLAVVCDNSKLDDKGCKGAPDLVIEILSPSTARSDTLVKYRLYQNAGVREYWIVNPDIKTLQVSELKDGRFVGTGVYDEADTVNVGVLSGCAIDLAKVFAE